VPRRYWNLLPCSLRAGTLACSDATPGTIGALLRLHLSATHFGGLSSNQPLLSPSVERMVVQKRADSPRGSEHAIKKHVELCLATTLCNQLSVKNGMSVFLSPKKREQMRRGKRKLEKHFRSTRSPADLQCFKSVVRLYNLPTSNMHGFFLQ